ncbi:LysR family transcriptional regulator [Afifella sp. H1R]|uniref:LysR family transcriptional regulator n=1 Tax=Afifella sp. H1R TaxID=2908841 RepID=UPI001F225ECE|nr:LysR family transcriptional regulator [Afifella sp. H1R]MCF1503758.1 LysR family transcriptional regulator [Afifella sp. H1R]
MVEPFKNLAWDDFRLIKAIADAGRLPAAAELLGINHSTVFRRLGQIEATLGVSLFERHRTGYVPTAVGEEMVELASDIDERITGFGRKVAGAEVVPEGEVRVTTSDTLLTHLFTPLFARFREKEPRVRLDIVVSNQALNLSKRDADVAIRATDTPPENLVGRRVARINWGLYGRAADFPSAEEVEVTDLFDRPWVALGERMAGLKAVRFVHEHVPAEKIVYRISSVLGLAEAIAEGIGIGHLPCFIGNAEPGLTRLASAEPAFATDLWLLTHPDLRHAARIRALLDFLAAEIARDRDFIEGRKGREVEDGQTGRQTGRQISGPGRQAGTSADG